MGGIRRVLSAAALGMGIAGLASAAYQGYGTALDRRRYPPPGGLTDIDGRKLHLLTTPGAGPPLHRHDLGLVTGILRDLVSRARA